ncbi:metal ABC transporter solute-binding protein [Sporolactobacillus sp. CPB3-1]|uniref:Metal ABC transporter solute-binding protein n=1 Tax=Sporolactobacillus mangiferae TaxID=2940498 RepID=A0ABT0M7C2_9BACL|nr:metal ABC transporter solute-binding protein [Sporolactobacillus mangiferae]MCL1630756.1 metal ABC transporter solute-binding protein [Sporolactobacillus mangiferae]
MGILILLVGILAGCGSNASSENGGTSKKINIVAAEDFYGEAAEAVGGKYVKVTSVINKPSMDPHDYEPTTGVAKAVSQADVVVYNGIGYDGWMTKLVNADDQKVVRVAEDVMGKKDGDNEHLWYQPETMPKLADKIADQLAKVDAKHADEYKENAKKYKESIKPVKDKITELSQNANQKLVDVSEPVFDYTLDALGYKVANNHFELAVEQESDPSPKDVAAMQKDVKEKRIAFFVSNIQEMSPTVKKIVTLADQNKVPVIEVTETLPSGKNYKTWMLDQLKQIEDAQNSSK